MAGGLQVNGASGAENVYDVNGMDITNIRTGTLTTQNRLPVEAIQQVQVKNGVPGADAYQRVFNSQTGQWGTQHDASRDVAKVVMKKEALRSPAKAFTIDLKEAPKGGILIMTWELPSCPLILRSLNKAVFERRHDLSF